MTRTITGATTKPRIRPPHHRRRWNCEAYQYTFPLNHTLVKGTIWNPSWMPCFGPRMRCWNLRQERERRCVCCAPLWRGNARRRGNSINPIRTKWQFLGNRRLLVVFPPLFTPRGPIRSYHRSFVSSGKLCTCCLLLEEHCMKSSVVAMRTLQGKFPQRISIAPLEIHGIARSMPCLVQENKCASIPK